MNSLNALLSVLFLMWFKKNGNIVKVFYNDLEHNHNSSIQLLFYWKQIEIFVFNLSYIMFLAMFIKLFSKKKMFCLKNYQY